MPGRRVQYTRAPYAFPDDFPERLERLRQESGLS